MKKTITLLAFLTVLISNAQTNPAITSWLQNTTGITGRHYVSGNPTPIVDASLANVQTVQYSTNWAYVTTNGIPAYITGPFLDGNPSLATSQAGAIFKFPLNPTQNTGTATVTTGEILDYSKMALLYLIIVMGFLGKIQQVLYVEAQ